MSNPTSELAVPLELPEAEAEPGLFGDLMTLTKARLSLLVIITTFLGFCMASDHGIDWRLLMHAVLGTSLAAAGAAVLNQVVEAKVDRLMERTRFRPIAAGRMSRAKGLLLGLTLCVAGCVELAVAVNSVSASLAVATIAIYVLLYTPLKRKTALCVMIGAVSGAIPPVIGWTAVHGSFGFGAWVLFGILFTWQMPHFLAIAWMYRDEYRQAGFVMLKSDDVTGASTAMQSLVFTLALGLITVFPFASGMTSENYLGGALAVDSVLALLAVHFLLQRERSSARALFFGSILFLPLLLGLMVCTKA